MSAVVDLLAPRHLIPRVQGRDLHVLVDEPNIYLRCEDVEELTGLPRWGTGEVLLLDETQIIVVQGAEYYAADYAIARARTEAARPAAAAALITWFENSRAAFLDPVVLEQAHRPASIVGAYTVAAAARELDRAGIPMGRDRLFEQMSGLGWIERNSPDGVWVVTKLPHDRDWLVLRHVRIGPAHQKNTKRYAQIHVTPAGLAELRRILTPAAPPPDTGPPQLPTLFD